MEKFESYNPDIDLTYDSDEPSLTYTGTEDVEVQESRKGSKSKTAGKGRKKLSKKSQRKISRAAVNTPSVNEAVESVKSFISDGRTRAAIGITAVLLGAYLLIAFLSFITSGFKDQSAVNNLPVGATGTIDNLGGEGGARLSEVLINDSFGIASAVIIIWLIGVALKQFGLVRFKIVNFTIKCIVALVTTSLIIGLLTIGLDSHFMWGGAHGYYINQTIIHFLGWYGAALLCILLVSLFFLICLYDIYKYFKRIYDRRREERLARLEAEEKQAELERRIAELQALEDEHKEPSEVEILNEFEEQGMTFAPSDMEHEDAVSNDLLNVEDFEDDKVSEDSTDESLTSKQEDAESPSDMEDDEPAESSDENKMTTDTDAPENEIAIEGEDSVMTVKVNEISQVGEAPRQPEINAESGEYDPRAELSHYQFPPSDLLVASNAKISVDQDEQLENQEKIRSTLADFGITITEISATVGPTVTLYEIKLDSGVRINKVRNLGDDIALSLAAIGVRIIAPIPGRGTVGIEVANKDPQTVSMRTVIESKKFHECKYELPVAIGSTIDNQVFIADLAKMPHLLVAGATGQGKSVGLNAIIASLLYRKHPAELKFVLVDPKMVEFSLYRAIERHYLAKLADEEDAVITRPEKVVATLSSLCVEMDERYELLKAAGVRNIKEYNAKFKKRILNPEKGHKFMPYIVVIVDEFADLIMTAGKEVETPIARLAQKARAVGIHVILATQRPSANVITGVIKANFPARMAFKVASGVDSKTILDTTGAQQLIGRGDLLFSNNSEMERIQCAFIDTPEVTAICNHIAGQPGYPHPLILPEPILNGEGAEGSGDTTAITGRDSLFEEVARWIVNSNTASTSSLQRRYSIGYVRAGKIMDQLESAGIVGPSKGGKPRSVLVDVISLESMLDSL
ncbi:MAG: DNA translocase FtsK [Bacteroidales bacterium]|nr:DNA translocase FtsK [Bacteroidales bacterium]